MSVVDGAQPFGAVCPRHVSRKNACGALLAEPPAETAWLDSNTMNRPSPLTDGRILLAASADPSGAIETSTVLGVQSAGASTPSQVSASKIADEACWLEEAFTAAEAEKATKRPLADIARG